VSDSVQTIDDRYGFESLVLTCGSDLSPSARVRLQLDGDSLEREASGVGPVDAIFRAISELTDTSSELIQYQVHAVTAGLDAQGEVSVTIEEEGRRVIGNGVHEDVMVASAKAYVHALNKLEWHKQRRDVDAPRGI
jgi:2-isopropylmalate synthase